MRLPKANAGLAASMVNVGADRTTVDAVTAPLVAYNSAACIAAKSAALSPVVVAAVLISAAVAASSPASARRLDTSIPLIAA